MSDLRKLEKVSVIIAENNSYFNRCICDVVPFVDSSVLLVFIYLTCFCFEPSRIIYSSTELQLIERHNQDLIRIDTTGNLGLTFVYCIDINLKLSDDESNFNRTHQIFFPPDFKRLSLCLLLSYINEIELKNEVGLLATVARHVNDLHKVAWYLVGYLLG